MLARWASADQTVISVAVISVAGIAAAGIAAHEGGGGWRDIYQPLDLWEVPSPEALTRSDLSRTRER